jgi:hypothetical protein
MSARLSLLKSPAITVAADADSVMVMSARARRIPHARHTGPAIDDVLAAAARNMMKSP